MPGQFLGSQGIRGQAAAFMINGLEGKLHEHSLFVAS